MLAKEHKLNIIKHNQMHTSDTGSTSVQIELLGARIRELSEHLKNNPKDLHSLRGLKALTAKRRKLAKYATHVEKKKARLDKIL